MSASEAADRVASKIIPTKHGNTGQTSGHPSLRPPRYTAGCFADSPGARSQRQNVPGPRVGAAEVEREPGVSPPVSPWPGSPRNRTSVRARITCQTCKRPVRSSRSAGCPGRGPGCPLLPWLLGGSDCFAFLISFAVVRPLVAGSKAHPWASESHPHVLGSGDKFKGGQVLQGHRGTAPSGGKMAVNP